MGFAHRAHVTHTPSSKPRVSAEAEHHLIQVVGSLADDAGRGEVRLHGEGSVDVDTAAGLSRHQLQAAAAGHYFQPVQASCLPPAEAHRTPMYSRHDMVRWWKSRWF